MALNVTNYTFDIDMVPKGFPPVAPASQGDIGRVFVVNLYWNGTPWTPASGTTCKVRGKKPDKTVFNNDATISGSTVTFTTTEQMTIIDGKVECELVFSQGSVVLGSANFIMMVEESPYNPNALSESVIPGIESLIEAALDDASGVEFIEYVGDFTNRTFTRTDTDAEVFAKIQSGKYIIGYDPEEGAYFPMIASYGTSTSNFELWFVDFYQDYWTGGQYSLLKDSHGTITYIPYGFILPSAPSANGTYTLKAVKSNNNVNIEWVKDT